jgi:hypothetical protein
MDETPPSARFRLRPDAAGATARRMNRRFAATVAGVVVIIIAAYAGGLRDEQRGLDVLVVPFVLLLLLAFFSYRRRMGRFRARWASFEIALAEDAITRDVQGFPVVRLRRDEIASIEEIPTGLAVRDRGGRGIVVPRDLEGYARIRAELAGWAPITAPPPRRR